MRYLGVMMRRRCANTTVLMGHENECDVDRWVYQSLSVKKNVGKI